MAEDFGFAPCTKPGYYFVSYNSEDAERVGAIARSLHNCNVPLWYDYGIPYDEKWESVIAKKVNDSKAILLFFTKGILFKENSYVRKEYIMAREYFNKKVYVIVLDNIDKKSVPVDKVSWFIDICDRHIIDIINMNDLNMVSETIMAAIDIKSQPINAKPYAFPAVPSAPPAPSFESAISKQNNNDGFDDDQFYTMIDDIINGKKNKQNLNPITSENYITTESKEIQDFSIMLDEIIQTRERKVQEMFAANDPNYSKDIPVSSVQVKTESNKETEIKPKSPPAVPGAPAIPSFSDCLLEKIKPDTTDSSFDDDQFYIMINEIIKGKQ